MLRRLPIMAHPNLAHGQPGARPNPARGGIVLCRGIPYKLKAVSSDLQAFHV